MRPRLFTVGAAASFVVGCAVVHFVSARITTDRFEPLLATWSVLACVLPSMWIANRLMWLAACALGAKRRRGGLCPACGYDLRASADRCPECGAEPKRSAAISTEPVPE